ncbi:hypothetical protein QF043_003165 [Pseudomonas sp. W3I7]|uniref:hypothetical protein n=1 Tax=Pseudomonas sp. W3I7 TaxID=3042292 RepID=UPI0027929852|nr:hypothetical protein [Pseudomonas sp. W3I7]MDQ0704373.1 hypothetical protein [Pseudomonas sp. W3I7]
MKLICTPLTLETMNLLDTGDYPNSLLESISLTNGEYQQLWESELIDKINAELEKMIDDYEDESINTHEDLKKSLYILENHSIPENQELARKIIKLNKLAIDNNTGLYFFF